MLWARYLRLVDNQSKTGKWETWCRWEGQSGKVFPPYAGRTAIANRIQSPTSKGIQLMPNLGQPVTQTAIRGRRGGARTDRRCVCCFVFIKPILGNRYGPGVIPQGRGPGVARSSPCSLTTSLATPVPSSSSSVAASIHERYMDARGNLNKVAEDAVFKSPCVVIIFDEPPRYWEVQSKHESKHPIMEAYRDRASSQAGTREETRPRTRSAVARQGQSW